MTEDLSNEKWMGKIHNVTQDVETNYRKLRLRRDIRFGDLNGRPYFVVNGSMCKLAKTFLVRSWQT